MRKRISKLQNISAVLRERQSRLKQDIRMTDDILCEGTMTEAQLLRKQIGHDARKAHETGDGKFLWTYASVKNILTEEAYTGVLINHRREYRNGSRRVEYVCRGYRRNGKSYCGAHRIREEVLNEERPQLSPR